MNLIRDQWIPARRRSGARARIAPHEIVDNHGDDPWVALGAARPDFNGALAQFLIGLLQTTVAPERGRDWRHWYETPPLPEQLAEAFETVAHAFELAGEGPRFMQDLTLFGEAHKVEPIEKLLIDAPGKNTLERNTDLFIKRHRVERLCHACAAMTLFTLQTNAPGGGQGHRTGLRGGGPLTTLVLDDTSLWRMVWLGVLERDAFLSYCGNPALEAEATRFPWLQPTRTSEKDTGAPTTPEDAHPAQMYWSMPRRLRLVWALNEEGAPRACDLCGVPNPMTAREYAVKNLGVSYEGPWLHPLSPYWTKDDVRLPLHPKADGIQYRHWLGLVQFDPERGTSPARIVQCFLDDRAVTLGRQLRLWAFGYEMDNMKARSWHEGVMPLVVAPPAVREAFEEDVTRLVQATVQTCRQTLRAVKASFDDDPKKVKGDLGAIEQSIWQDTEGDFFAMLSRLLDTHGLGEPTTELRRAWQRRLVEAANAQFDTATQSGYFDAVDAGRVARAWNNLQRNLYGPKIRQILALPEKERP